MSMVCINSDFIDDLDIDNFEEFIQKVAIHEFGKGVGSLPLYTHAFAMYPKDWLLRHLYIWCIATLEDDEDGEHSCINLWNEHGKSVLDITGTWSDSPQGSEFWNKLYTWMCQPETLPEEWQEEANSYLKPNWDKYIDLY